MQYTLLHVTISMAPTYIFSEMVNNSDMGTDKKKFSTTELGYF